MPDNDDDIAEVEVIRTKPKKQREFEERVMRALSAINGNIERIAVAMESVAEATKNGAQLENPFTASLGALRELFAAGPRGRRKK